MAETAKKDDWKAFVKKTIYRKRSDRRYKLPLDYILGVADKIHKANPSKDILLNILTEVYEVAYERGYQRRILDNTYFNSKREKHISDEWNKIRESIDDEIHSK